MSKTNPDSEYLCGFKNYKIEFQSRTKSMGHSPPIDLHLIFEKSSLKNQVGWTWFFVYFELTVKFKFEIDKRSSSSNLTFQTWFFKNQLQMDDRALEVILRVAADIF